MVIRVILVKNREVLITEEFRNLTKMTKLGGFLGRGNG